MRISDKSREAVAAMHLAKMSPESIAKTSGLSLGLVKAVVRQLDDPPVERPGAKRQGLSRFGSARIEVERSTGLASTHPALSDARTIFPGQVVGTLASPRFLVSGHNNPKLGKQVLKGEREGWPIFHLTLEERATCPRSCAQWADCYGNAMPYARRHRPDSAFLENLRAELQQLQRQHGRGFLIRLHALGDFYSVAYVLFWAEALRDFPALHVFGYTARRIGDADPETDKIARAVALLSGSMWGRFAIRTSHVEAGAERSIVVDAPPTADDVILCPAQVEKTAACATCGLCWAEAARPKTIAFLRHGMKRRSKSMAEPEQEFRQPEPAESETAEPEVETAPAAVEQIAPAGAPPTAAEPPPASITMAEAPKIRRAPLAELPPAPRPRPPSRAISRGARIERRGDGVSVIRMKAVSDPVVSWSRAYLARGGVTVEYLADLFDVDADALSRAVGPKARAA